jgi:outer membrane lipopolysaccharide assembly protein LptE/RlpB
MIDPAAPRKSCCLKFQISNFKFEIFPLCFCVSVALLLSACGYHVGGTASQLPPGLKVIAVPALKNDTTRYRIEQGMTEAVVHEFIARTKYRIVSSEESADAVLHGEITGFEAIPAVFDTTPATTSSSTTVPTTNTQTARATTMLVSVHMKVLLEERETNKVLYKNDNYLFRQPYEISTDPAKFFDEQGPALERMSRDFASRLVSDVLENF